MKQARKQSNSDENKIVFWFLSWFVGMWLLVFRVRFTQTPLRYPRTDAWTQTGFLTFMIKVEIRLSYWFHGYTWWTCRGRYVRHCESSFELFLEVHHVHRQDIKELLCHAVMAEIIFEGEIDLVIFPQQGQTLPVEVHVTLQPPVTPVNNHLYSPSHRFLLPSWLSEAMGDEPGCHFWFSPSRN